MTQPAPHHGQPSAEIDLTPELVRTLLQAQFPHLASRPITLVAEGWDNCMFRVGDDLTARLPRRTVAVPLMTNEQAWLAELAPRLPLPVPAPLHIGAPSADYPWCWSIVPWLDGDTADVSPPRADEGATFANFLRALHIPAPANAPTNSTRGVPLSSRVDAVAERANNLAARGEDIGAATRTAWEDGLAAPIDVTGLWLHGDLHPRNVLVKDGRFSAIIDWGDMCAGDPATDIGAIWMLFETRAAREAALNSYAPSQATFTRARGWAAFFAIMLRGVTNNPPLTAVGGVTMQRLADGP